MSRIFSGKYFTTRLLTFAKKWSSHPNQVTEDIIKDLLRKKLQSPNNITVNDVSGGCGAMFEIFVESSEFKGKSIVQQHRLITDILKKEIKQIHGLRIATKAT